MKILAVTGGVGGAKLALGLSKVLGPHELAFVVNTGDDFEHLGLHISPDVDSLTYALAEQNNNELGWGRQGETWQFIETLGALGGEDWFRLGDKDLALHHQRTQLLRSGHSLTEVTRAIGLALGIEHQMLPMSDDPVRTMVQTAQGELAFQHYFVRERCEPEVTGFRFDGIETAQPNPALLAWLQDCDGIIICPSNPYVSVDPILQLGQLRTLFEQLPVVAISPIVGGMAIKGPAAKMMAELQVPASPTAVAQHYGNLLSGFIIDETDASQLSGPLEDMPIASIAAPSVMVTLEDRILLAETAIRFLSEITHLK